MKEFTTLLLTLILLAGCSEAPEYRMEPAQLSNPTAGDNVTNTTFEFTGLTANTSYVAIGLDCPYKLVCDPFGRAPCTVVPCVGLVR